MQADHAWCEACEKLQPIIIEPWEQLDPTEPFRAADVSCAVCGWIVCTLYAAVIDSALH